MKNIFFLFIILPNLCFSQVDLKLGLQAYYPFSGNANDESGNRNHPVFNNAALTSDRLGNSKSAYHFNGKDTYMRIPNSSSLNMGKKMSISLWVKPTKYYTGRCYNNMLVTKSATTTFPSNYYLRFADVYTGCDAPKTTSERFTGNNAIAATPFVKLDQWYSVVWTSDGITERIYVNCELKGDATAGTVPFSNAFDMFFGCQNSAQFPYWFNGDLDEIRIYDRPLNKEEIDALCDHKPEVKEPPYVKTKEKKANGQVDLTYGLQAYYPFSGNAKDESGNKNHPVFNNASLTADRFGNAKSAYYFNGVSAYMKILNSPFLNTSKTLSLCVWVNPRGFYNGQCHGNSILMKGDADYLAGNYFLRFEDGAYLKGTHCDSYSAVDPLHQNFTALGAPSSSPYVSTNRWYSLIATYDGKRAKLYIDCKLVANLPQDGSTFTNPYDLFLGRANSSTFPYWFKGDLDDVRIYDRALNKEEILALCDEKPTVKKPEYVKVKEKKNKEITKEKKENVQPQTVKETNPLININNPVELDPGSIKLFNWETEKEIVLEKRDNDLVKTISVDHDSISVTLYDNGDIDGDSITLIYNDKVLTTHQRLTDKPLTFYIKIAPGSSRNELQMYAENLGSIPPNTALMVIYDGEKRYEVTIKSTEKTNGSVSFKLRE